MPFLQPESDRAVRSAVDAYLEGRIRPEIDGEAIFETRNSRYHLVHGMVRNASDPTLVGAELVGWLSEAADQIAVGAWWRPGARAILVDRRGGKNIVVTSATRLLRLGAAPLDGSPPHQGGSVDGQLDAAAYGPAPRQIPQLPPLPQLGVRPLPPPTRPPPYAMPPAPHAPAYAYPPSAPAYPPTAMAPSVGGAAQAPLQGADALAANGYSAPPPSHPAPSSKHPSLRPSTLPTPSAPPRPVPPVHPPPRRGPDANAGRAPLGSAPPVGPLPPPVPPPRRAPPLPRYASATDLPQLHPYRST